MVLQCWRGVEINKTRADLYTLLQHFSYDKIYTLVALKQHPSASSRVPASITYKGELQKETG